MNTPVPMEIKFLEKDTMNKQYMFALTYVLKCEGDESCIDTVEDAFEAIYRGTVSGQGNELIESPPKYYTGRITRGLGIVFGFQGHLIIARYSNCDPNNYTGLYHFDDFGIFPEDERTEGFEVNFVNTLFDVEETVLVEILIYDDIQSYILNPLVRFANLPGESLVNDDFYNTVHAIYWLYVNKDLPETFDTDPYRHYCRIISENEMNGLCLI